MAALLERVRCSRLLECVADQQQAGKQQERPNSDPKCPDQGIPRHHSLAGVTASEVTGNKGFIESHGRSPIEEPPTSASSGYVLEGKMVARLKRSNPAPGGCLMRSGHG